MTKLLHISDDIALPKDFVTQTAAILAKRRVGKTYSASVIAEEMVGAGLPFVALDPTGAWWGLRAAADGKSEGLPVVIIGGAHGDVPLEPTAGKVIADLVVDHPGFYVIDLSATESDAQQDRFAEAFAERLYRRKEKQRDPLHLFVDEADVFMPQRPFPNQTKMLGAFEALVRRGGIRGVGMTMITQRPAVLNKNVLTQCEMLIVLQMTAPQDQDAIDDWVKRNGTKEQRDTLMGSLSSLKMGEAWIWSPAWLEVFKQVHIRARRTFNSSATPKAGERVIVPQKLAPVDLQKLGQEIQATIERAKAEDPKSLHARIKELQKQLQAQPPATKVERIVERVEIPIVTDEQIAALQDITRNLHEIAATAEGISTGITQSLLKARGQQQALASIPAPRPHPTARALPAARPPATARTAQGETGTIGKGERAILAATAQYPEGVTREQLTVLTGYKRSSRDTYLQRLQSRGLVASGGAGLMATGEGVAELGEDYEPLPTGAELQTYWLNRLSGGEQVILKAVLEAYPEPVAREVLSEQSGYQRSSRDTYIQRLMARRLVTRDGGGIRASELFFE
jgi:hypothetical protein